MTESLQPATDKVDIAIIGGGMVGAALANLLVAANPQWQVLLVERFPLPQVDQPIFQPSFDARSTAISAGSVDLLQAAGLWSRLAEHATAINQVHVSERGHLNGCLIDAQALGESALGYVLPNQWLGTVMLSQLQQLPQIRCEAPASVISIHPRAQGVDLLLQRDGVERRVMAGMAVIADGVDSRLRQQLGIDVDTYDYHQHAVIANVTFEQPHGGVAYERFTDQGPLALLPLGESDEARCSALVWTHPAAHIDEVMQLSDRAFLDRLQQRFGQRVGRFVSVGKRDSYALQLTLAREQVRSSLVVMGNAAHFLHPVAGQGFNLALRDCAVLSRHLLQAAKRRQPLGELQVLQGYLSDQQRDQWLTVSGSDALTRLFSNDLLPLAAVRGLGLMGLNALPAAKRWFSRQSMGRTLAPGQL